MAFAEYARSEGGEMCIPQFVLPSEEMKVWRLSKFPVVCQLTNFFNKGHRVLCNSAVVPW
jgi:hypothetical protein